MKKGLSLAAAVAATLMLGGCYSPQDRAVGGAALGGATGALIGGAASNSVGGALAGGLIGAAAGGIIGANTAPPPPRPRCAEFDIDYYGNRHCIAWYN
jgi:osmotically inducible lipoprotein OsmB